MAASVRADGGVPGDGWLHWAAAVAAARGSCSDVGLIAAAAGAVSEALHLAELASLAGVEGANREHARTAEHRIVDAPGHVGERFSVR